MSLENDIAVLRQVPFFARFGDEHLRLLAFGGENRRFRAGQTLYRRGDPSDGGMVVLAGQIGLSSGERDDGVETFAVASLFGQRALLARTKRHDTATALEDCEVLMIRRTLFMRMLSEFPDLAADLYETMSQDLQDLVDRASHLVGARKQASDSAGD